MGWSRDCPEAGDFSHLVALQRDLEGFAQWLDIAGQTLLESSSTMGTAWSGSAASQWCVVAERLSLTARDKAEQIRFLQRAVNVYLDAVPGHLVREVELIKSTRQTARDDLVAAKKRLLGESLLVPGLAHASSEAARIEELEWRIDDCERRIAVWREERIDLDARLARAFREVDLSIGPLISDLGLDLPPGSQFVDGLPIPVFQAGGFGMGVGGKKALVDVPVWWFGPLSEDASPAEIRSQWDALTPFEQEALIRSTPKKIGKLDGIPLEARCRANQINIENEIARLEGERDAVEAGSINQTSGNPEFWPVLNERSKDGRLEEIDSSIAYFRSLLDHDPDGMVAEFDSTDPETWQNIQYAPDGSVVRTKGSQVLLFDPEGEGIAIYHGSFDANGDIPSMYTNVGLYVPGTGTLMEDFGGTDTRTTNIHVDSNNAGAGSQAMIVWSGGPQPDLAEAVLAKYAQDMGPKLTKFCRVNIPDAPVLTVMGHSYGATTVAQAEATGLMADRVLYVAPAGYGKRPGGFPWQKIRGLEDFPKTGDVPHYVLMSRTDPIVGVIQEDKLGVHGESPTFDPEITRLETGWRNVKKPELGYLDHADDSSKSHSTVFERETTSYENIVAVMTGGTAQGWVDHEYTTSEMHGPVGAPGPWAPRVPSAPLVTGSRQEGYNKIPQYHKDEGDWPDVPIK